MVYLSVLLDGKNNKKEVMLQKKKQNFMFSKFSNFSKIKQPKINRKLSAPELVLIDY